MEYKLASTPEDKQEAMGDLARNAHHIDKGFVSYLTRLNSMSLYTTQCCQGHEDTPGEEPGSGFRRAYFRFYSPHAIGILAEMVFMPMLVEQEEEFLEIEMVGETGTLGYVVWLDNKTWRKQVERFIELYGYVDEVAPFFK